MSQNLFAGRIEPVQLEDEIQRSYLDYAMSVIVGRALPDVRDGLKPVHRRILWSMLESGLRPDRPHRTPVSAVGEVLKKYPPHGDQSVYDALVRMAQDWSLRVPLIDGHGNFGSVDGDPPAAYRYTEARLPPPAPGLLPHMPARPRVGEGPCRPPHRGRDARSLEDRRDRAAVPGEQGARGREDRRPRQRGPSEGRRGRPRRVQQGGDAPRCLHE